ncbi:MAG: S8 family peptidase [Burkholderiaceae bacterium]
MLLKPLPILSVLSCTAVLVACGGGSDGDTEGGSGAGLNEKDCAIQYVETSPEGATGTDPLLANQWHLNNTGQSGGTAGEDIRAFDAWSANRGEGVRVAVIDDAIEVTHEDLVANVVPGKSYNYRPDRRGSAFPLPCNINQSHGTAVAGLIAARDNNGKGVSGSAPRSELVGFNGLATSQTADIVDALNRDLAEIDVYNNSWGSPDIGVLNAAENVFIQAIDRGIRNGRDGKGVIYVFPAGNGGCYATDQDRECLQENSNYDGYVNKLGVITACAVDHNGRRPFYGEIGANMLVCGPSSNDTVRVTTADIQNRYQSGFTGTSASTPIVAGITSLILAANPSLTWRDVQQILVRTARRNDPSSAGWTSNFGLNFNPIYGFGTADADAAVQLAGTWTSIGGRADMRECGPFRSSPNQVLADAAPAIDSFDDAIAVSGCDIDRIEFVEIGFTANHTYSGDLRVDLISPAGLVSPLASERICARTSNADPCGRYSDWRFGSVRHMDEPSNGNWTLRVADAAAQDTGTFVSWSITFYGR